MSKPTEIDKAWEQLFDQYKILTHVANDGMFRITSKQINVLRQARLMAKFDQSAQLPTIFLENGLSILPVTKGNYLIGPFKTHEKIDYSPLKPTSVAVPPLETIDSKNLYSESAVLFFAYNSGIIKDIMNTDRVRMTVSGRMGSGDFSFSIQNTDNPQSSAKIDVKNSQIEIDAGFESPEAFMVCEAKNQASEELLIRQLYYPYRLWCNKISKPVIPMFLAFSNDIFHAFTYKFMDIQDYNSLTLENYRQYTFAEENVALQDIIDLWSSIVIIDEPSITFPQADSFPRVLDLLSVLHEAELNRSEVTMKYEFDPRQTTYYVSACKYLGLVEHFFTGTNGQKYRLTKEARTIMSLPYKKKHLALVKKILERPVFHKAFRIFVNSKKLPDKNEIYQIMASSNLSIGRETLGRRWVCKSLVGVLPAQFSLV